MNKPKVFIYPGDSYHAAIDMFTSRGFEVLNYYGDVDLVVFLGGTDVDPKVYGEERGPYTQKPDTDRDALEVSAHEIWKARGVAQVGICRGGQLLNVLNGGRMIQHLGKYVSGDVEDDEGRVMRVDHHQGMLHQDSERSDLLSYYDMGYDSEVDWPDYAIYYEDTKSLCFQPHPEWGHKGTEDYFFELLETHLGLKGISDV